MTPQACLRRATWHEMSGFLLRQSTAFQDGDLGRIASDNLVNLTAMDWNKRRALSVAISRSFGALLARLHSSIAITINDDGWDNTPLTATLISQSWWRSKGLFTIQHRNVLAYK